MVKRIVGIKPVGTQVLVEQLTTQESMGTILHVPGKDTNTPQGYVLAIGPMVSEAFGIKVGMRVFFSAPHAYLPPGQTAERQSWCIEWNAIKGILMEEDS